MTNVHIFEGVMAVIVLFFLINGLRKGLLRMVLSFGTAAIALIIAMMCYHYVGKTLNQYTSLNQAVEKQIASALKIDTEKNVKKRNRQMEQINELKLPDTLVKGLLDNNNEEMYEALNVKTFNGYIAKYLAVIACNSAAFLLTYIIAFVLLKLLMCFVDMIAELPIIHGMNKLGGLLLGGLEAVVVVWLLFLVINIMGSTSWGQTLLGYIEQSKYLSWAYNTNLIMDGITNLSNILF
ncbi:MAG: CvpA family protein [Lachnospiraceae bacterium]